MTYAYQSLSDLQDHRRCPEVDAAFKDQLFRGPNLQVLRAQSIKRLCPGGCYKGGHMILDDHVKHTKNGSRTRMRN